MRLIFCDKKSIKFEIYDQLNFMLLMKLKTCIRTLNLIEWKKIE